MFVTPSKTNAQKIAQRTLNLLKQVDRHGVVLSDFCTRQRGKEAKEAFAAAATFHRQLDTTQYVPGISNFLTDLLFFNLTDPFTAQGDWELQQLLHEAVDIPSDGRLHATSHHSWHILELRNPDFTRPILYQFGAQRPGCFAVYPSEGIIEAGTSIHVTVSITPLGSAQAYATEGLDILRDGLAGEWTSLYSNEAHLPLCPFLLRYRFATIPPQPVLDVHGRDVASAEAAEYTDVVLEHHLEQNFSSHLFRNIYLSAHVNAHYNFWDFLAATCHPWTVERRMRLGPQWFAPILASKFPRKLLLLDDRNQTDPPSYRIGEYTEGPCEGCGAFWGPYDEELMYEFFSALLMASWHITQRETMIRNVSRCIDILPLVFRWNDEVTSKLLYAIHSIIQVLKASRLMPRDTVEAILRHEIKVDGLCQHIQPGGEAWIPWRYSGVYKHIRSTDSIFGGEILNSNGKDEPDYLDAFRHLTHCLGSLCLGRQVDQNHIYSVIKPTSRRFVQKQGNPASDIFMDDPISALEAGICMLYDPRSLLLHGVYDRIRYPGSVVRRPRMDAPHFLGEDHLAVINVVRQAMYDLPKYIHDIPPPGVGRFVVSTFRVDESNSTSSDIVELELSDHNSEAGHNVNQEETLEAQNAPLGRQPMPALRRGPRFIQLLWTLGASLGLVLIDSSTIPTVFVDRTILIATHWINLSLMIAPLIVTLVGRCGEWIPSQPADYQLDGLPFRLNDKMRYMTENECGLSSILVFGIWMGLGRWSERHTCRDFFRSMLEHLTPRQSNRHTFIRQIEFIKIWLLRCWDGCCPLFLQNRIFSPEWNLRTKSDFISHLAFWRAKQLSTHRSHVRLEAGHPERFFGDSRDDSIDFGQISFGNKIFFGIIVVLASFCSSTPHFWLNMATVFSCSISLGISVSVQSLEKGRPQIPMSSTKSFLRELNLLTVFSFALLVGHLVGSSGGTMFLAEFIVTSISLLLGGAGTVSASAMESWLTFFILACTAFWGYLFGRVGLIDGILMKRQGSSSLLLSSSVAVMVIFWSAVLTVASFDTPASLVIHRPTLQECSSWSRAYAAEMLQ
jgi:hypothetical protein